MKVENSLLPCGTFMSQSRKEEFIRERGGCGTKPKRVPTVGSEGQG